MTYSFNARNLKYRFYLIQVLEEIIDGEICMYTTKHTHYKVYCEGNP